MSNFFDRKYAASSAALVVINGDADYTRANCFMEKEEEVKMHNRTMPICKNGNLRKILSLALAICICLSLVATLGTEKVQAASAKMTRLDFIKEVVKTLEDEMSYSGSKFKGAKLTIKTEKSGKITVGGKSTTAAKIKAYKTKFNVSLEDAQTIGAAISMGLMKATTFTTVKKNIKRSEAAIIMAKAHELVYGANNRPDSEEITQDDIDLVIKERITDIKKIKLSANRTWFAKAYLYGFIKGSSDGQYTHSRTFKPGAYPTKSTLTGMIDMLFHTDKRVKLSYDWQVCRTTKLPKTAYLYEYILDSFPNSYYDTEFNYGGDYAKDFYTTGLGSGTLEERMSKGFISFVRPSELVKFSSYDFDTLSKKYDLDGRQFWNENRNMEIPTQLVKSAEEFYTYALNVDYKTIENDKEWKKVMSKYLTETELNDYIKHCKENKTVITCDKVAADLSSAYWNDNEYQCKIYAHFKIVSDTPLSKGLYDTATYGNLIPLRRGLELGDRYFRLILGEKYMGYKLGTWTDYYFNASGTHPDDAYGCLNTSETAQDIMIDYTGNYPWLIDFPYRQ